MGTVTCELVPSYAAAIGAGDDKANVGAKLGVPHEQRRFTFFAGNGKGKGRRVGDGGGGGTPVGSWYGGLFRLRRRTTGGRRRMQVFVRTLAGKSLALDVSPSDTVDAVKARIQAKERVAAGDQRLVFAGRDLDDGRRTLAACGVRKEANLFLHLRLRGGAGGGAAADAAGCSRGVTAAGVLAVGAALACFPAAAAAAGTGGGGLTLALVLFLWALAVAGVNLITAGVYLTGRVETLGYTVRPSAVLGKASAFVRQNLGVLGIAAASSAATGVVVFASDRAVCFISFAMFLLAICLVTIGVASSDPRSLMSN
ncbi:unnamed protein product [Urochloa decumbens]|uniref:Ubiquitin-like domain-containing protein n=1 Tax=Urochloa decumbens TaxID=240449 RepID=A0ABC9BFJ7_9POAL